MFAKLGTIQNQPNLINNVRTEWSNGVESRLIVGLTNQPESVSYTHLRAHETS